MDQFNTRRLLGPIGDVPPAEFEASYYSQAAVACVVDQALAAPERTPRELAGQCTDREDHFHSEASVYRILHAYDLITSPAFVGLTAGTVFQHPTHRPNELWQTDFTYLHIVWLGWYSLSAVLDDYSRHILAWTLRTLMSATDVTTARTSTVARCRGYLRPEERRYI